MANPKYKKGYEKERKIVNRLRAKGYLAFRSAGSHSPIDVFGISKNQKIIRLIQSKSDNMSETAKQKLLSTLKHLEGEYMVIVEVL